MPAALAAVTALLLLAGSGRAAFAQPGTVLGVQEIAQGQGGFTGPLSNFDFFGEAVAAIGDLDGAGPSVLAVAVGAPLDDAGGGPSDDYGAVWILFLDATGNVLSEQKIGNGIGGLTTALGVDDFFGSSLAGLGDLDGDGSLELAVGAPTDDDGAGNAGAVYILSLATDGTVASEVKISATAGGFGGTLDVNDRFGSSVALLGDVDGDSRADIAVGAINDDDGGSDAGAVWVLFLDSDGTVLSEQKISETAGGFTGALDNTDNFGNSLAGLGDLDGDGFADLAVGALNDDDGGTNRGAVYVLFLDDLGTVVSHQKIAQGSGGFAGTLDNGDTLGSALAAIGDIDADLVTELVVGARGDGDGGSITGAVYVLSMSATGSVLAQQKISSIFGGFDGTLVPGDNFGSSAAALGDLDGDGVEDVFVGARFNDDGGSSRGGSWVVFLDGEVATCGNGVVEGAEDCDDGNTADGDCCDSTCRFDSAGVKCLDGDLCNGTEVCDGAGTCLNGPPLNCNDGNACTDDSCEAIAGCINDPNTNPCNDGNVCTIGDVCSAGDCVGQAPLDCDDGNVCTSDTCDDLTGCVNEPALKTMCRLAQKGKIEVKDHLFDDTSDKIKWTWQKGAQVDQADLGDPAEETEYTICVFDQDQGTLLLSTSLTVPPNGAWDDKAPKGWDYQDNSGVFDGVTKLKIRTGSDGKARVDLQAKGVNVPMPAHFAPGQIFAQDPSVIVQMVNDLGTCWESEFEPGKNAKFKILDGSSEDCDDDEDDCDDD